jgi:hypothetical protein
MSNSDENQLGHATTPKASQAVEMLERVAAHADSNAAPAIRSSSLPIPEPTLPFGFSVIPVAACRAVARPSI